MNNTLSGIIFLIFGIGLLGDSIYDLYNNSISMDAKSLKSLLLTLLGISSCIYGYKKMTEKNKSQ